MLFWESLSVDAGKSRAAVPGKLPEGVKRLPFDHRCSAITKAGRRCKGRICEGSEFCSFHNPAITREQRCRNGAKGGRVSRHLATLPGGYLSKLNTRRAVGEAMDRLYREVRLGLVTPEMGNVLFSVLTRLLDSGLCRDGKTPARATGRTRAERIRPKLAELLTVAEHRAWRRAVANAPDSFLRNAGRKDSRRRDDAVAPAQVAMPAAS